MKNPFNTSSSANFVRPENQSAGILDDFAVRKNVASREGTVEKVPVNDSDIVNKKYCDSHTIVEADPIYSANTYAVAMDQDVATTSDVTFNSVSGDGTSLTGVLHNQATGVGSLAIDSALGYSTSDYSVTYGYDTYAWNGANNVAIGRNVGITAVGAEYITAIGNFYIDFYNYNTSNSLMLGGFDGMSDAAWLILTGSSVQFPMLTTDGFVKTSNSDGTLIVDTNTYLTAETDPDYNANTYATGMDQGVATTDDVEFNSLTTANIYDSSSNLALDIDEGFGYDQDGTTETIRWRQEAGLVRNSLGLIIGNGVDVERYILFDYSDAAGDTHIYGVMGYGIAVDCDFFPYVDEGGTLGSYGLYRWAGAEFYNSGMGLTTKIHQDSKGIQVTDGTKSTEICYAAQNALNSTDGTYTIELITGAVALTATNGTYTAQLIDGTEAGNFYNSTYSATLASSTSGVEGSDGTNTGTLGNGTYGVNSNDSINTATAYYCGGTMGYTGDLNDSISTKIADVVGGIITAVYY